MGAMLIGLWTALESLAQDTWITAVNACPAPLANNVMAAPDATLKTGNQSKSLSYSHFSGSNFDFRNTMGNLLFAERKVDFQHFNGIRAAYNVAFAGELEAIFQPYQIGLFRLEATRNLLAHKGGIIDAKFLRRIGDEPGFVDAKENNLLWISGSYVATQANSVSAFAGRLVSAVDKWLDDHVIKAKQTSEREDSQ
jgi:hypothetical protein